jgi:hypothetical protein
MNGKGKVSQAFSNNPHEIDKEDDQNTMPNYKLEREVKKQR